MSTKTRKKPYEGRVEYRAVQDEVEKRLAAGHSIHAVYEQLAQSGHLTICYSAFCDYVRGKGERCHKQKNKAQTSPPPQRPMFTHQSSVKKSEPDHSSGFVHERNVDLKELI